MHIMNYIPTILCGQKKYFIHVIYFKYSLRNKGFNTTIIPTANINFFVIIKSTRCIKSYDMSNQDSILLQNEQDLSNI